jgi:hypothetical protein
MHIEGFLKVMETEERQATAGQTGLLDQRFEK